MTRKGRVEDALARDDIDELRYLAKIEPHPCACAGPVDGEPECWCRMNISQIEAALSIDALRRGEIVRLKRGV